MLWRGSLSRWSRGACCTSRISLVEFDFHFLGQMFSVLIQYVRIPLRNRIVCFDIKELGKQLKKPGMLIVQDQIWGRVTANRSERRTTRCYLDEFHLLLKDEQTAAYSVEIWKRFRKWGGVPTGITQNIKDLLSSREIENIFENSDFVYMLNQASGDRQILAKQLNISPHQLSYVTQSGEGEGLLFYGNIILPFADRFPRNTELYRIMTSKRCISVREPYSDARREAASLRAKSTRVSSDMMASILSSDNRPS